MTNKKLLRGTKISPACIFCKKLQAVALLDIFEPCIDHQPDGTTIEKSNGSRNFLNANLTRGLY